MSDYTGTDDPMFVDRFYTETSICGSESDPPQGEASGLDPAPDVAVMVYSCGSVVISVKDWMGVRHDILLPEQTWTDLGAMLEDAENDYDLHQWFVLNGYEIHQESPPDA